MTGFVVTWGLYRSLRTPGLRTDSFPEKKKKKKKKVSVERASLFVLPDRIK